MAAATILRTPLGRRVKVVEHGTGTPVVFLHSGVGSAGEWKRVFSLWPEGYRLIAIEAYRDGTGPTVVCVGAHNGGFHWDEAGVGAGAVLAVTLIGLAGAVPHRRRSRHARAS